MIILTGKLRISTLRKEESDPAYPDCEIRSGRNYCNFGNFKALKEELEYFGFLRLGYRIESCGASFNLNVLETLGLINCPFITIADDTL